MEAEVKRHIGPPEPLRDGATECEDEVLKLLLYAGSGGLTAALNDYAAGVTQRVIWRGKAA